MVGPVMDKPIGQLHTGGTLGGVAKNAAIDPGTGSGMGGNIKTDLPPGSSNRSVGGNGNNMPEDPGTAAEELEAALERFQNDPELRETLLSALGATGGADEIAAMMIKLSNMSRENVLDQRLQARSTAKADLMSSAQESREAATKQIASAIVSFVVSVISAVVSLAGSIASFKGSMGAVKEAKEAHSMEKMAKLADKSGDAAAPRMNEMAKNASSSAEASTLAARRATDVSSAVSNLTRGLGELVGGSFDGAAKIDEAEGKEHEANATDQQAQADVGKKTMDDIEEMVKSAIQFLKAMQAAEVDLMASMTRV